MTKSIANVVNSAEISTLEAQGKALHNAWKRIVRAEKKQILDFDLPLGKLLVQLSLEAGGNIKKERLQECNIHNIPKQRRSDAKQLAELWCDLTTYAEIKDYLPRFSSTSAMLKAYKADKKAPVEPKAKSTEGEKSDVGQTEKPNASKPMQADDVAVAVLEMLEANNISLDDFNKSFEAISAILQDEDTNKQAVA